MLSSPQHKKNGDAQVSRWIEYINGFDFAIEQFQGNMDEINGADYLSRKNNYLSTLMNSDHHINNVCLVFGLSLTDLFDGQSADKNLQNFDLGYRQLHSKKLWKINKKWSFDGSKNSIQHLNKW